MLNLRVELFAHLQRLSLGFFERRQLGDIMSRLGGDVSEIETLVLTGVNMALTYAFRSCCSPGCCSTWTGGWPWPRSRRHRGSW